MAKAKKGKTLGWVIASNIEKLRTKHGLTKKEMAKRMGIDPSNYQKLLASNLEGRTPWLRFNHEQIERLASTFRIKPSSLLDR